MTLTPVPFVFLRLSIFSAHEANFTKGDLYIAMGYKIDGHEAAIAFNVGGGMWLIHRLSPKGWARSLVHRQPVIALACFWALAGVTIPLVVPPIRRALGLATSQYDAEHPKATFRKYT